MWQKEYENWKNMSKSDPKVLEHLSDFSQDELLDAFDGHLDFGTGGARGLIGPGTNRMNRYTVRRVSIGLGEYLLEKYNEPSITIAYDTRNFSKEFAFETARVMVTKGIKVYLFDEPTPTPELSFAVRQLKTSAGVVITASHNPPEYNGFKIYNETGGQETPDRLASVSAFIEKINDYLTFPLITLSMLKESLLFQYVKGNMDQMYLNEIEKGVLRKELFHSTSLPKVLYSSLHGTGDKLLPRVFSRLGFSDFDVIKEQQVRDGYFPTVSTPNPEDIEAFNLLLEQARKKDSDILLSTDPDADRLGVMCKHNEDYRLMTGNQVGILLLVYLLEYYEEQNLLNEKKVVLSTIVSSTLVDKIADFYGINSIRLLTGFKYIGEYIEKQMNTDNFIFGFEESCGYLVNPVVRDKDSIQASLLLVELATYLKQSGKTLIDKMDDIYKKFGFSQTDLEDIDLSSTSGLDKKIMQKLRELSTDDLKRNGIIKKVDFLLDYESSFLEGNPGIVLPKENVLKFLFDGENWVCIRLSGTEPKIKIYYESSGKDEQTASQNMRTIKKWIKEQINF